MSPSTIATYSAAALQLADFLTAQGMPTMIRSSLAIPRCAWALVGDPQEAIWHLGLMRPACRRLVDEHAAEIVAVARLLAERTVLTGEEIAATIKSVRER